MRRAPLLRIERETRSSVVDHARRSEAGDTLIEVLLALIVIGVAALAILLAFSTSIWGSSDYRKVATVDTVLRSAAEDVVSQLQQPSTMTTMTTKAALETAWQKCTGASQVKLTGLLPPDYTPTIVSSTSTPPSPEYWNATTSTFTTTCEPNSPQLITISVQYYGTSYPPISVVVDDPWAPSPSACSPGAATHLAFISQPSSGQSGSTFVPSPVVAVEDTNNCVVTNDYSTVLLNISAVTDTNGATLSSTCAGVEFYGAVDFSNCNITKVGTYTLTATDGTLPPATSGAFNITPSAATQLVYTSSPPSSTEAGATFPLTVAVAVQDAYGNTVTNDNASLSLNSDGGNFSCTTLPSQFANGVAAFSGCSYTVASPTAYTLTATSGNLTATANTTVSSGAASLLVFTQSPSSSTAGTAITPQPKVTVKDSWGNIVTTDSSTVTLAIGTNPSGGTLSGCTEGESAGVVSFTGCTINLVGTGYTLTATDAADDLNTASTPSSSFNVTIGATN